MITKNYNPSSLELELTEIIANLKGEIEGALKNEKIVEIRKETDIDNPMLHIKTQDSDGDFHEVTLRIIQAPDRKVN